MSRAVRLDITTPNKILFKGRDTFRVVITVAEAIDMPKEIFGFQRTLIDPYTGREADEFQFVCSAYDLSAYPANVPNPAQIPAYFRKSQIDVLVPGLIIAERFIDAVKEQVCTLRVQMDTLDRLGTPVSIWCGPEPATPEPVDSLDSVNSL